MLTAQLNSSQIVTLYGTSPSAVLTCVCFRRSQVLHRPSRPAAYQLIDDSAELHEAVDVGLAVVCYSLDLVLLQELFRGFGFTTMGGQPVNPSTRVTW